VSLSFYLDHHLPAAIAADLRQLPVDVLTVAEDGTADSDDDQLLERALELWRIVFTQDRPFLVLAVRWQ
jgi:predicted nuclease of predicted toxin-antitoxin system